MRKVCLTDKRILILSLSKDEGRCSPHERVDRFGELHVALA